ncbi:hypothetical protein [Alteromonas sp. 14N.309.X.WAT.G.H12]|uniref:hypothetical protein n=1 Tax=Alteromonas sp. 14N.309.X.WAT.G.H12 TaxID=3120824 RepID=UPI002FD66F3E
MNEDELADIAKWVHDARKPLNRISMQAEMVKMALNGEIPIEKATLALDKIIHSTKDCSQTLTHMMEAIGGSSAE